MIKKIAIIFYISFYFQISLFAQLADKSATLETRKLYKNLHQLYGKSVLFGHQDDMAYGVGWKYKQGRSDIKDLTGEYPAVFGWDVAGLEKESKVNIDGVPFNKMRQYIIDAYSLGAINTISWHTDNPLNGKSAWDTAKNTVQSILPQGLKHEMYKNWLDKFSVFVKTLKTKDGISIPLLFRPFHEHTGGWFWWGVKSCTVEEYKLLWQFTVKYLRDNKQLHQLIYVFNPADFKDEITYLERYPGDDYVDILSFDSYQYGGIAASESFKNELIKKLSIQHQIAMRTKKIGAIAETGFVEVPMVNWWTNIFEKAIAENRPSYVLFWRNAGYREKEKDNHYYVPYSGQASADDFIELYKSKAIMLQKGLKTLNIYQ